jgi:transcriptional regulator with XRE-family HTH domain
MVGVSPTYLSQVEQDKVDKPPTAERVRRMAELLSENADEWVLWREHARGSTEIIKQQPTQMPELLREASGLSPEQLKQLIAKIRRTKEKDQ